MGDDLSDSHDDQLHQVPELVMDFVDMNIAEPNSLDQLQEAPVTPDTSQAEDAGAVTPVSDQRNQSLSSTAEGDTISTDARESFSETCQAIFGCGPSSLPGSLACSPSCVPGSLTGSPSCDPGSLPDNPSILPGLLPGNLSCVPGSSTDNPSILPRSSAENPSTLSGSPSDNPSVIIGLPDDNPSIVPGLPADNPSIFPGPPGDNHSVLAGSLPDNPSVFLGPRADRPLILPGSLPDNLSGVSRSLVNIPSIVPEPQANRPVYVPGSHADNPFYLPGPRAFSPSSHHSSLSDSSSSSFTSSPASSSWSYQSSSSGRSPVSDMDNIDTSQLDVSNSSQSSSSSSGSEDHVPRYTAGKIQVMAVADKQSAWKDQVWNYFEQKFVSPKKENPDVQLCASLNQTGSFLAAGVSSDDNHTNELKSAFCCKDVPPKEITAGLCTSANKPYSPLTDSDGVRFVPLENEPEKGLFCDLDPPVSKRGSEESFRMETVHEKDNPGPDIESKNGNKEISNTMKEYDKRTSPKRHFPQTKYEGTRDGQVKDFKRVFPISRLTRRNKCSPGVFVSPDNVGTRRIKRLSEEFTGSDSAISALCMPSKKMKTDTPAMSRARKRLGKWLK